MYEYNASLDRIVDGDTVWLNIDLGLRVSINAEVRLAGINAPELNTEEGVVAAGYLAGMLIPYPGAEMPLIVQTIKDSKKRERSDNWDRWLAYIWTAMSDGTKRMLVNACMVDQGHAVPMEPYPVTPEE